MAIDRLLNPETLTSEERWRRWEQRGRDNDAQLTRRMRRVLWSGVVMATAVLVFLLVN